LKRTDEMDELLKARAQINRVDKEMAQLFLERMEAVKRVAQYKKERGLPVLDTSREKEVIEKNSADISDPVLREYYARFLQEEMKLSRKYQRLLLENMRIAYSGVEGAFAHRMVRWVFPDGTAASYPDFQAAYEAVEKGDCDCCVLPVENSFAGEVGQVMDLMLKGDLIVNGMYSLPVTQHLLGVKESNLDDVKRVISHPQALSQCAAFIRDRGYEQAEAVNTAVAAKMVKERGDKQLAAIASLEAAELYGLKVLKDNIQENSLNTTRFAVFAARELNLKAGHPGGFLLLFMVNNVTGALAKAVQVISDYGFNMRVLRSRPVKNVPWQYYFYVEAEGDETSEQGQAMLQNLRRHCSTVKVVGHFHLRDDEGYRAYEG
jgi:chorismate mutase/prephenate dehydratase